jgi:hypothetical protein
MKKKIFVLIGVLLTIISAGCSSDDNFSDNQEFESTLIFFSQTGCKKTGTNSSDVLSVIYGTESIEYEGTKDGYLIINHINALFCCDANITTTVSIDNNVITIFEHADPITDCICPYDLNMKIGPLKNITYSIVIEDGHPDKKSFTIEFDSNLKGIYNYEK